MGPISRRRLAAGVGGVWGRAEGRVSSPTQLRVLAALNSARVCDGDMAGMAGMAEASLGLYEVQPCHPGLARARVHDEPRSQASNLQGVRARGVLKRKAMDTEELDAEHDEEATAMEVLWLLQTNKKAKVRNGLARACEGRMRTPSSWLLTADVGRPSRDGVRMG